MIADAESILKVCGLGTYLYIGCEQGQLVFDLLKRAVNAYGLDANQETIVKNRIRAPERFFHGSLMHYPFDAETFDTIVIGSELLEYQGNELGIAFAVLQRMTKRNLVLYFSQERLSKFNPRSYEANRLFWEKLAIASGFRRHVREMLAVPYHELENEQTGKLTFFERVPEAALQQFSYEWLLANRDLHMDMLREAGRRSDAHVSRYVHAANRIRPGDVVLDAACGLGYGTAVLAACSPGAKFIGVDIDPDSIQYANANYAAVNPAISYQTCDVTNMAFLADHSVDAVISFETIEHVPDYDIFLAEVKRVLKPDGRFVGSVPNLWCDETGNDPNPHHFHVFDWNKLKAAVGKYFIVDERTAQTAGGGFRLRDSTRVIQNIPMEFNGHVDPEWWMISACGNPVNATTDYTNPFNRQHQQAAPQHVDFAQYYENPWFYRVMVQLGERIIDKNILTSFCGKVARDSKAGSADQGAALCVIGYQLLESGNASLDDVTILIDLINKYDQAYAKTNPHAYRWAISLHYIGARLLLAIGKHNEALAAFLSCAAMDVMQFSPLLATKTISSCMYAGLILANMCNYADARKQFLHGIQEAHRVMQGDWKNIVGDLSNPLSFGLQEASEVLEIASLCAQALQALDRQQYVPGYFWERINLKRFGLVEWNKNLERENETLRRALAQVQQMNAMPAAMSAS